MIRRGWSVLLLSLAILCPAGCLPDSEGSGGPPVPGGPPGNPDSVLRRGGDGPRGLDHKLRLFGIAPTLGPAMGGTDVLIVGFNFEQAGSVTEVLFGSEPALTFEVRSNNQIDSISPPHPAGLVGITVRNAEGQEAVLADVYEYAARPPTCLALDPTSGPDSGGTVVTIDTENFTDDFTVAPPLVFFDTAQATSVIAIDGDTVTVITPADPNPFPPPNVHPVDVTVESASGLESCVFPQGFTYAGPTGTGCMSIQPPYGPLSGGSAVTITSLGPCLFEFAISVTFAGVPATGIILIDPFTLSCVTPADPAAQGPGPVDVEVTVSGPGISCSCLLPDGFTYR